MDVVSTCPLRVASIVWQPRPSAWTLTVVCKATFVLVPGEARLCDVQEEPIPHDRHLGGDPARSLHAASDLVPWKPRAEVLLVGSAFAPQGRPARAVTTRLNVGEIDKRIDVRCDRVFWQDGRLLEGQPFAQMPLVHERAAGGPGTANPLGMRFDAAPDTYGSVPIPNLQPAGLVVARRGDTFAPIAYGPVARPAHIDAASFNSAPPDQQLASIRPDERILLENLHAEHPLLVTRLPGLRPRAHLMAGTSIQEEIALTADTLWIDTDRGLATVVWRGRFALSHAREEGRIVVSLAAAGAAQAATGVGESATLQLAPAEVATILGGLGSSTPLPFQAGKSPWGSAQPPPAAPPTPMLPEDTGTVFGARSPAREILPFPAKPPAPAPFVAPAPIAAPTPVFTLDPGPEPPMIGPLARVDIAAPGLDLSTPASPATAAGSAAPPEPEPPPEEYPLERCAAITASIARRRAETAQILEENDLTPTDWAAREQRWSEAIVDETRRGKTGLLHTFDAAYVARLEEERGPIQVEEYARLVIAAERGTLAEVLAEMTLPPGGMIRIERIWLAKLADDAQLGKRVRRAIESARRG